MYSFIPCTCARVLSLARSVDRRQHVRTELAAAGVEQFTFVDALDGDGLLPEAEVVLMRGDECRCMHTSVA